MQFYFTVFNNSAETYTRAGHNPNGKRLIWYGSVLVSREGPLKGRSGHFFPVQVLSKRDRIGIRPVCPLNFPCSFITLHSLLHCKLTSGIRTLTICPHNCRMRWDIYSSQYLHIAVSVVPGTAHNLTKCAIGGHTTAAGQLFSTLPTNIG